MAPIIKPGIQPKNITNSPRARVGGVVSPARKLSPLVENISAKNPFSNIQRRNPELRNVRGARTLTNMMSTFGTAKNEKIIRKNLQLLRNSLVESFEMAKLLRATGNETGKQISKAGLLVGAALGGLLTKLFGKKKPKKKGDDDKKDDDNNKDTKKAENQFAKSISEFFEGIKNTIQSEFDKLFPKKEEETDQKVDDATSGVKNFFDGIRSFFIKEVEELNDSGLDSNTVIENLNQSQENHIGTAKKLQNIFSGIVDIAGKGVALFAAFAGAVTGFNFQLTQSTVESSDESKPVGKLGGQI